MHEVWWALKKSLELFKNPTWNSWPEKVITYGRNYFLCDIWTELALDWHCFFWCQAAWSPSAETELHDLPSLLLTYVLPSLSCSIVSLCLYPYWFFFLPQTKSHHWYLPWWDWYSVSLLPCRFCLYPAWWIMGLYLVVGFWRTVNSWYESCDLS